MADKERVKRLASALKKRKDAKELVKKSKKPLFDKEKIADRIPADGGYPGGTSGVVDAVRHYLTNDDNYVGDRIKNAMDDASRGVIDPVSLSQILDHEDAKRIYLGMPQVYGSFEPSPYRPTVGTMENPYQLNSLLTDESFDDLILPMYATWKTGKDWPVYDTASRVTDLGKFAQLDDIPALNRAGMSEGYDDKGQYISLHDVWDYNTAVKGKSGDNIAKYVGGKPFDIYQRYYLDDWLDVPEGAKGNPYIAPSYIEADYTGPRYVPDYTFCGFPQERGEWDPVNGFACGGKKFDEGGYKDKLINWSVNHPGALWADTKEAAKAREWLRKNAPEELSALYWNESDDMRKGIDRRFVPDDAKGKEMQFNVSGGISDAGRNIADKVEDVAAWLPGPIGAGVWLGNTAGDISDGNYGKAALDLGLMALMGGAGHYAGKAIGKYAPRLMQKFPRLGKALDFLDDITWNDARRAEASDLWSRNLDARQRYGVATEVLDPVTGGMRLRFEPEQMNDVLKGERSILSSNDKDLVSNELYLGWLNANDPKTYDDLIRRRRLRRISRNMLEDTNIKDLVSPITYDRMLDGNFEWESAKMVDKFFPDERIMDKYGHNVFYDWRNRMKSAIDPVRGFDLPLGYDVTPFTGKLDDFAKARDAAYEIMRARAAAGEMSPVVQPLINDVNGTTSIMGKTVYPTTATSFQKPGIHFTTRQLDESFSLDNSITIGLKDYFDPNMNQHDWFHSHYGSDVFADPYFVVGHEVGHRHPGFNTYLSKQARDAMKGKTNLSSDIVAMRHESPMYGHTYYGLNGKARTALTPTQIIDPVIDPHDAEFSEWFSDKIGDATMMKMWGINDGTRPYTMKDLDHLTKKMEELYGKGAKTRFSWFFETPEARLNALNNGWANGGQMNRFDGGGRYYKVPTPIVDGQNAGNYVDEQPNYSDGMFGGIDVSGFYDTMGRLRMPLPEVQATKVEPVRVDTTPEWYNMVPLLYDVPTGMYSFQQAGDGSVASIPTDLFSDEAKAMRKLRHAYVESRFNRNAENKDSGARGLFQIMPIAEKDYLGRGRGKQGDIWNADYNGGIRDWVMKIIPGDLQEFWSDNDSDINKLAKLYAAYNWGAGNLRKFFRDRLDAGLSNDDPYEWVEAIKNKGSRPDETKNYVKFLALNQDIPDSYMTTDAFEKAAKARGYMDEGGRLFEEGGPEGDKRSTIVDKALGYILDYNTRKRKEASKLGSVAKSGAELLSLIREEPSEDYNSEKKRKEKILSAATKVAEALPEPILKRAMEVGMRVTSAGTPEFAIEDYLNSIGENYGPNVLKDALYVTTGIGKPSYDYYNGLYNSDVDNNGFPTVKVTPDIIDAIVYGKEVNPAIGVQVNAAPGDYGIETSYINRQFPGRKVQYIETAPHSIKTYDGKDIESVGLYPYTSSGASFRTSIPGIGINNQGYVTELGTRNDSTFVRGWDVFDFASPETDRSAYKNHWYSSDDDPGNRIIDLIDKNTFPLVIRTPWVLPEDYHNVVGVPYNSMFIRDVKDLVEQKRAKGGKIRIKPSRRGTFTAAAKKHGKSVQAFASQVLAHKENYSPSMVKKANFARNSKKWKHGDGGPIDRYSPEQIRAAIARLKETNK